MRQLRMISVPSIPRAPILACLRIFASLAKSFVHQSYHGETASYQAVPMGRDSRNKTGDQTPTENRLVYLVILLFDVLHKLLG